MFLVFNLCKDKGDSVAVLVLVLGFMLINSQNAQGQASNTTEDERKKEEARKENYYDKAIALYSICRCLFLSKSWEADRILPEMSPLGNTHLNSDSIQH